MVLRGLSCSRPTMLLPSTPLLTADLVTLPDILSAVVPIEQRLVLPAVVVRLARSLWVAVPPVSLSGLR